MAKRIKIKGKPPRGFSKAERMHVEGYRVKPTSGEYDPTGLRELGSDPSKFDQETLDRIREFVNRAKQGSTKPSSTRKKRVKEGNRKFVGPRRLEGELAEDNETKVRAAEGAPVKYIDRGPGRAGHIYEVDEGGILPFETSKREIRQLSRLQKETNPASKRRVNEILRRILEQYLGGGQEFDAQY